MFPTLFPSCVADFLPPQPVGVAIDNFLKHLMMYEEGRFARHPQSHYFALITEMRSRTLHAGHIYVCQYPHDAQLSVEELRGVVGYKGETFSNHVLHYTSMCSWGVELH